MLPLLMPEKKQSSAKKVKEPKKAKREPVTIRLLPQPNSCLIAQRNKPTPPEAVTSKKLYKSNSRKTASRDRRTARNALGLLHLG
jgi:hypothetical protein